MGATKFEQISAAKAMRRFPLSDACPGKSLVHTSMVASKLGVWIDVVGRYKRDLLRTSAPYSAALLF
jgi:hypothetical protein